MRDTDDLMFLFFFFFAYIHFWFINLLSVCHFMYQRCVISGLSCSRWYWSVSLWSCLVLTESKRLIRLQHPLKRLTCQKKTASKPNSFRSRQLSERIWVKYTRIFVWSKWLHGVIQSFWEWMSKEKNRLCWEKSGRSYNFRILNFSWPTKKIQAGPGCHHFQIESRSSVGMSTNTKSMPLQSRTSFSWPIFTGRKGNWPPRSTTGFVGL